MPDDAGKPHDGDVPPDPAPRLRARHGTAPWLRRLGTALLFTLVALLLAPTVVPPFLDRIYYRGPPSDHYDGRRFFNPDGDSDAGSAPTRIGATMLWHKLAGGHGARWPATVPVTPGYPPAAATACPITPGAVRESWARCVAHPDPAAMFVTWIGHSTVLVQVAGLTILTDPVWSDRAGPWGVFGPKRVRAPGIRFDDLPKVDLVLVSHDHYDHMDLATLRRLWARDRPLIVTSLGNDAILARAGISARAADWGGRVAVRDGAAPASVIVERVHHWGTRWGGDRNRSLWSGFTVVLPGGNLFFAGDTAWGDGRWVAQAARHGPFRLALIPIGSFQPTALMAPHHIGPVEAVEVFRGLGAARALAVHWGTFHLSEEGIDVPPALLRATLARDHIAPDRFRALEVGQPWRIPPLAAPQSLPSPSLPSRAAG